MTTANDSIDLTRVGPGTVMGQFMREYWIPALMWVAILMFIALVCPNTLQILAPYEPALGVKPAATAPIIGRRRIPVWGPSLPWAIAVSVVAAIAVFTLGGPSEFLYWQF